ncbi:hypothetical protein ACIHFE_14465 [Streptomyces sp. NPDC052396]|uniref:hypothetical protein n=1 Tax=Streptomyces sp. NPDC052396 TaxID=3365689 RepID=UPI0037CF8CB5
MRPRTHHRIPALVSTAALCLGLVATGCGSGEPESRVLLGDAGPTGPVPPTGGVRLFPLPAPDTAATPPPTARPTGRGGGRIHLSLPGPGAAPGPSAAVRTAPTAPRRPSPRPPSSPSAAPRPAASAALTVTEPRRAPGGPRWCEQVSLVFANAGPAPVAQGTVIFGAHVIAAGGAELAALPATRPLPVPIGPGRVRKQGWRVCVDARRVPPDAHLETRDVWVQWN